MHIGSSQPGLVKAIQLMVAEMKGTPAVHCCLKIDQPQKNSCHTKLFPHVWPSAPDLELRGGVVCPEQTDTPKGKPCNVKQSVYMSIT